MRALRQAQGTLTLEKAKVVEPVETPCYYNYLISFCYFKSINGTELPSMYWGILPSHFCTAS